MKPNAFDAALWNELYATYVEDKLHLDTKAFFDRENPYALQEVTAVMLETVRKGLWQPTDKQLQEITKLHLTEIKDHGAGCSGFICGNAALNTFISGRLQGEDRSAYQAKLREAKESSVRPDANKKGQVLTKVEEKSAGRQQTAAQQQVDSSIRKWLMFAAVLFVSVALLIWFIRKNNNRIQ